MEYICRMYCYGKVKKIIALFNLSSYQAPQIFVQKQICMVLHQTDFNEYKQALKCRRLVVAALDCGMKFVRGDEVYFRNANNFLNISISCSLRWPGSWITLVTFCSTNRMKLFFRVILLF